MPSVSQLSPGIISMLPMFYIGWSDSVLSPSEMKLIHKKIGQFEFITPDEKAYLIKWTDPTDPPPTVIFKQWVREIYHHAQTLDLNKRRSLAEMGLEMALSSTQNKNHQIWKSPKTRKALVEIESALGLSNDQSTVLLLSKFKVQVSEYLSCSFKIQALQDLLDGRHKKVKNQVRKLLRDPIFKYVNQPDKEIYRIQILNQLKALARQGVGAYAFPKEFGGFERKGDHIAVFETVAYHDLSLTVKFGVQFGLFGGAIFMLGTAKHHKKYLEAIGKGELLGCFAMTETDHGSNVKALQTSLDYDNETDKIIVNTPNPGARKDYIGNALHGELAVVFGQLKVNKENKGIHAVLVPIRNKNQKLLKGIKVEDCGYKMGLNGVDNGRLYFDQVVVPSENLLDRFGQITNAKYSSAIQNDSKRFFTMLGTLVVGRISVGLASVSAAKSALTIAIQYALKRKQFEAKDGDPEVLIMDYPTHQWRLIPSLSKAYAYHFALQKLANQYTDSGVEETRRIETLAAGLKAKASWFATKTIQECREACGGAGYLEENRFSKLKADSDIFSTFEGDNTVLMQLVAKGLLTEFKQSFHDEGYRAVIRYLYTRVSQRMIELNPVNTRNTNIGHLLDSDFHINAFKYREQNILISLSSRMRKYLKQRIDPFQAFLKCQIHMISLSHAFIARITLEAFQEALNADHDETLKKVLSKICSLYALTVINENKGWYLESGYMEGLKTKAIRRIISKLCSELRPELAGLVDAFGIPEELLGANIAMD